MSSTTDFYSTLSNKSNRNGPKTISDFATHLCFRTVLCLYIGTIKLSRRLVPQNPLPNDGPIEILLTGTFFSDNWIISLLRPLALSKRCGRIRMVSTTTVPFIEKVEAIYPPKLLIKIIGRSPARLATFIWLGFRTKPHIIGGLHLLINGLMAILLAKLLGVKALYSCCGGPTECEGGGYNSENHLFSRLHGPDPFIEHCLLNAISAADLVITRGKLAIQFFKERGITTGFHVIPGGMDGIKFSPSTIPPISDLIIVGNLVPRKRVDIFIEIVSKIHDVRPDIRAVVLGDGPLRQSLEAQTEKLHLQKVVYFAGYQNDVVKWLQQTKIFILTSEAEGLSQAMIQGMLCGLPAVVSHVGEAEELVEEGVNGFLIRNLNVEAYVKAIIPLLENQTMLTHFSKAARQSAERCDVHYLARKWDEIFNALIDAPVVK
jgi:glycosyltransferase involved in cell wall biosynthesis